jgi:multisite-specific tRNA:(cytosine-C5)-methyltransferase
MAMLSYADGSRVVYSTCSMNPIENEAVIAAALNTVPGKRVSQHEDSFEPCAGFELADVRNMFPSMKMAEGVSSWLPQPSTWSDPRQTKSWKTWEEYCSFYREGQMGSRAQVKDRLTQTMFPPSNITSLHMDRWYVSIFPGPASFFILILFLKHAIPPPPYGHGWILCRSPSKKDRW